MNDEELEIIKGLLVYAMDGIEWIDDDEYLVMIARAKAIVEKYDAKKE